jgi:hypothetical protein
MSGSSGTGRRLLRGSLCKVTSLNLTCPLAHTNLHTIRYYLPTVHPGHSFLPDKSVIRLTSLQKVRVRVRVKQVLTFFVATTQQLPVSEFFAMLTVDS